MESIAWMAWTLPTAIFFALLAAMLLVMIWLAIAYPEIERVEQALNAKQSSLDSAQSVFKR